MVICPALPSARLRFLWSSVAFVLLLGACAKEKQATTEQHSAMRPRSKPPRRRAPPRPVIPTPTTCLNRFVAQHRDSYLADIRRQGFQLQDFQKVLLPRKVDVKICPPITATAAVTWKGQPVICYFRKENKAVVNGEVFSALTTLNARYLASGDDKRFAVGSVEGAALQKLPRKSLVMALIRSAVIMLYVHLEAKVCLFKETSQKDSYSASFHVDYVYETNRTNTGSYRITVSIDGTGRIVATSP